MIKLVLHTFEAYLENAIIPVGKNITSGDEAVKLVVSSLEILLSQEHNLLDKSVILVMKELTQ